MTSKFLDIDKTGFQKNKTPFVFTVFYALVFCLTLLLFSLEKPHHNIQNTSAAPAKNCGGKNNDKDSYQSMPGRLLQFFQ